MQILIFLIVLIVINAFVESQIQKQKKQDNNDKSEK
jgi:hypothetical protein